ncbi:MAG: phytase [Bacteroidales bacterium]|nr:phytase [Bacteroidales bacterium]MCF8455732.1 phytase [Bacteroidales bacterium]
MNRMKINLVYLLILSIGLQACMNSPVKKEKSLTEINLVEANIETQPVVSGLGDDAADDPAIWINKEDPDKSRIIGTNKTGGLHVYNMKGEELYFYPVGRVNNVDLRYDFEVGNSFEDIVAASNRTDNTIVVFKVIKPNGGLENIVEEPIISSVDEVYGLCMFQDKLTHRLYVFVNGKGGMVEQWELLATPNEKIKAERLRTFNLNSQPEGMVADDELGFLYIAEEDECIWKYSARPDGDSSPRRVEMSDKSNSMIAYDLEGLAIYYAQAGRGYLIASSQGNNSFAVFRRDGHNRYLGSFSIADGCIDGVQETDGIDVVNLNMGSKFPNGFFIAQDGHNLDDTTEVNQNFKLVSWEKIAKSFCPKLMIDNDYQP